jgi:hypothetical protein
MRKLGEVLLAFLVVFNSKCGGKSVPKEAEGL